MARYHRSSNWAFKSVLNDSAGVLVPIASTQADLSTIFQLNSTASFIWELLSEAKTENEIRRAIEERFEFETASETSPAPQTLEDDLRSHLRELLQLGAVVQVGA